jgi:hypothetical protein
MTALRIVGWIIFAVGIVLLGLGKSNGETGYLMWGAVVGCVGMILTYTANLVRQHRRARALPPSMRWSREPAGDDRDEA